MKKLPIVVCALLFLGFVTPKASADPVTLQDLEFNLDGTIYFDPTLVPGIVLGGFDLTTGLGTLTLTITGAGAHNVDAFMDYQLDPALFFNEYGAVFGILGAGDPSTWQIDASFPDLNFPAPTIYGNFLADTLDNTNYVPGQLSNLFNICGPDPNCNTDVATAFGFDFTLGANEQATITLNISKDRPSGGFFLEQSNPGNPPGPGGNGSPPTDIFMTGHIDIGPIVTPAIPEPGIWVLVGTALLGVVGAFRRRVSGCK